jgi:DNA-binding MarR family transcriptional regulator
MLELEEVHRQLFRRIATAWSKFAENGITASQGFILEKLENEGPLKVSQVAEALCFTSGAITALADKLISAGYAQRQRSEEDRRVVYLEITPKGRDMLGKIRAHRISIIETFFSSLSHEDAQHLIRIYKQILAGLDNNRD